MNSIPREHFETLYARAPDPWEYETNGYEKEKYADTLAILPRTRFARGMELGCSIGVLTSLLAARCDDLIGVDFASAAIEAARLRLARQPHVSIQQLQAPLQMPQGTFDLIVLSEVLYFFDDADLGLIAAFVSDRLRPGGACILVNFLGDTESPQTGDQAASFMIERLVPPLQVIAKVRCDHYRIDVISSPDA
jgi:SAM-dependent methyltransferase